MQRMAGDVQRVEVEIVSPAVLIPSSEFRLEHLLCRARRIGVDALLRVGGGHSAMSMECHAAGFTATAIDDSTAALEQSVTAAQLRSAPWIIATPVDVDVVLEDLGVSEPLPCATRVPTLMTQGHARFDETGDTSTSVAGANCTYRYSLQTHISNVAAQMTFDQLRLALRVVQQNLAQSATQASDGTAKSSSGSSVSALGDVGGSSGVTYKYGSTDAPETTYDMRFVLPSFHLELCDTAARSSLVIMSANQLDICSQAAVLEDRCVRQRLRVRLRGFGIVDSRPAHDHWAHKTLMSSSICAAETETDSVKQLRPSYPLAAAHDDDDVDGAAAAHATSTTNVNALCVLIEELIAPQGVRGRRADLTIGRTDIVFLADCAADVMRFLDAFGAGACDDSVALALADANQRSHQRSTVSTAPVATKSTPSWCCCNNLARVS